ncbi:MAG: hypothetical protein JO053_00825 [Acidobacteria bacterium]|nr:hypothetical protein [Acidobacteriota bacterium]
MKTTINYLSIASLAVVLAAVGSVSVFAQKPVLHHRPVVKKKIIHPVKPAEPLYSVATGTIIRARMNNTISSKSARVGDTFTVTVTEPIYASTGAVVAPIGSTMTGRVDTVTPAAKGGKVGQIDAHFIRLTLPNGRSRTINGSLTDLTQGKTTSDNEGTASGKNMGHRKVVFIGGGAAGGAILGGAFGGPKGALIGGLLGAGGGFLGDKLLKGEEAEVRSGTEFGVYLNQAISLPKFAEVTGPINP